MEIKIDTEVTMENFLSDDMLNDEEWTIINKEINTPRALTRLLEEQQRNCMSPETDRDDDCLSPSPIQTRREARLDSSEHVEFQRILEQEEEEEHEDELAFLRSENAELRLVVAQLRSYISTLQKQDKRRGSFPPPEVPSSPEPAEATEEGAHMAHSLRQDLLRMFSKSRQKRTKFE